MTTLLTMIQDAEQIQERINGWPITWRLRIGDHERIRRILHRANLLTTCTVCGAIMDTAVHHVDCILCGSGNTVSTYYC